MNGSAFTVAKALPLQALKAVQADLSVEASTSVQSADALSPTRVSDGRSSLERYRAALSLRLMQLAQESAEICLEALA